MYQTASVRADFTNRNMQKRAQICIDIRKPVDDLEPI